MLSAQQVVHEEIEAFEAVINRTIHRDTGIDMNMFKEVGDPSGSGIHDTLYLDSKYLHDSLESTKAMIRNQGKSDAERQQSNESRRGKLIREFESNDSYNANANANEHLLSELSKLSVIEIAELEMMSDIQRRKQMFKVNAMNRRGKVEEFTRMMEGRLEQHYQEVKRTEVDEIVPRQYDSQICRLNNYNNAVSSATRQGLLEEIDSIINRVLDVTVWILSNCEFGGYKAFDDDFPQSMWDDVPRLFASSEQIIALPFPDVRPLPNSFSKHFSFLDPDVVVSTTETSLLRVDEFVMDTPFDQSQNFRTVASSAANEYIDNLADNIESGEGNITFEGDYVQLLCKALPENSESTVFLYPPETLFSTPLKHLLGEIIVDIRNRASSPAIPPEPQIKIHGPFLKVILLGSSSIVRQNIAVHLHRELGVAIISLRKLIADIAYMDADENISHRKAVLDALGSGRPVGDALAVSVLVDEINRLQCGEGFIGYVLVDFPNNSSELIALLNALSGLDFGTFQSHPSDRASPYAPPTPFTRKHHLASASGVDAIININTATPSTIFDDVRSRIHMNSSQVIYLDGNTSSVKGVIENISEEQSKYTFGVETQRREEMLHPLELLLQEIGLIVEIKGDTEGFVDRESLNATMEKLRSIADTMNVTKVSESSIGSSIEESSLGVSVNESDVGEDEMTLPLGATESKASLTTIATDAGASVPAPTYSGIPGIVASRLAIVLSTLWNEIEIQSDHSIMGFFKSIHEVRIMVFSRRRLSYDALHSYLVRSDRKFELIAEFCDYYNAIEHDFRYDPDCKAELCLRVLELRDQMFQLAMFRKKETEDAMFQIQNDRMTSIYSHQIYCEGVSFLQNELNRFIVVLHLIFDYLKSLVGRSIFEKYESELEGTIKSIYDPEDDGRLKGKAKDQKSKDPKKGKKGDAAEHVPFRDAIPKLLIDNKLVEFPNSTSDEDKKSKTSTKVYSSTSCYAGSLKFCSRKKLLKEIPLVVYLMQLLMKRRTWH